LLFLIFVEHFGDHGRVEIVNFRGRRILTHGHMSDANRTFFHILLQRVDILEYGEQTLGGYFTLECGTAAGIVLRFVRAQSATAAAATVAISKELRLEVREKGFVKRDARKSRATRVDRA
jgi:hypothetical protein